MSDQENQEADRSPWTIKSVPVDTRKLAVACAAKQGQTMAEWLVRAVANQANLEKGERVIPPGKPGNPAGGQPSLPQSQTEVGFGQTNLAQIREACEIAAIAAQASGKPLPQTISRHLFALLDMECRAARGLPQKPVRLPPRKTLTHDGQTVVETAPIEG